MQEEQKVNVTVSVNEIASLLTKHMVRLSSSDDRAIANLIVGHLALTEKGLPQLFKALIGELPYLTYKEKDWVYVRFDMLPSWRMDKEATQLLPNVKDGYILAQITECNVYKGSPYRIAYDVIKEGEKKARQEQAEVREEYVREKAEDFVDILDALEKMKDEKDLPF